MVEDSHTSRPSPAETLRDVVAFVLHDAECGYRCSDPMVMGKYYQLADHLLASDALIVARGRV